MALTNLSMAAGRRLAVLVLLAFAGLGDAQALAQAGHQPMTADEIIELARPAVGHAYHWDHGNWTRGGSNIGECTATGTGCPACTFKGDYGADCSGFVAKAWQVPVPTPVEEDTHPYSTGAFAAPTDKPWSVVDLKTDQVRRGDAYVKGGNHIMLVDREVASGSFAVYHASGCGKGIVHETKTKAALAGYTAIRRDDVLDAALRTCGGHGVFGDDGTCHCAGNTAGDDCERCLPGYVRYPQCVKEDCGLARTGGTSSLQGTLNCGSEYTFRLKGGGNHQTAYGCGPRSLQAEEVGFQFQPPGVGTAKLSVTSSADVSLMLMRHDCSPDSCFMSDKNSVEFSFGGNDEFYVVLDAPSATGDKVTLQVECEVPRSRFIGDACTDDSDCPDALTSRWGTPMDGFCYQGPAGSFCSVVCDGSCPDLLNAAPTACAADPDGQATRGICLPLTDPLNLNCGTVPGTKPAAHPRYKSTGEREFCYPTDEPDACDGSFLGMVVDAASGAAVAGAQVSYAGPTGRQQATTDALGRFTSGTLPCGSHEFLVEADNYSPSTVGKDVQAQRTDIGQVRLQSFAAQCVSATTKVEGHVQDGTTDAPVEGASVELRAGSGVTSGDAAASVISAADGYYSFGGLVGGDYTVSATANGYSEGSRSQVSVCDDYLERADVYLTPHTPDLVHSYRFVLTWKRPEDLDLHLLTPSGDDVFFWETCRGSTTEPPYAALDADHFAANGPESITLANIMPGRYELFVHNFAAQNWQEPELDGAYGDSPASLADSGAELTVYDGADRVVERLSVPSTGAGHFWNVLAVELDASGTPRLTQVQNLTSARHNPWDEYAGECNPN